MSLVNAVVFLVAIAAAATADIVVAEGLLRVGHWHTGDRNLVIVDHTGDPDWEQATRHAVGAWNQSAAHVRLSWARGSGPCEPDGRRIPVCEVAYRLLQRSGVPRLEGLTTPHFGSADHYRAAVVQVCSNCRLDPVRRRVVATHEVGHVLGLEHSSNPTSVMHPVGGSEVPTAEDHAELRRRYDHLDTD